MKRTKRSLTALLALLLALLLPLAAGAAGTSYTLTLYNSGDTTHTFEVYQIFTGDLSVNGSGQKVLSNIVWGSGVSATGQAALGSAMDKAETLTTEAAAKAFAHSLVSGNYLTGAVTRVVAAGASEALSGLAPGYYLIKDQDGTQSGEGSAYTAYMLEVVGDVTASAKVSTPTVEKKVQDINDSADADISDNAWQDSADHDIGDAVPYQIKGTLPGNFAEYGSYFYQFTDEMSAGLTYQADARVFVLNGATETEITSQAVITPTAATPGATLTVSIADLKSLSGVTLDASSEIIVRYTALLNGNAVHGVAGNPNSVYLSYSNDPNPGGTGTGRTPTDKTVVFTYQLIVDKADENGDPLTGAGFSLYKQDSAGVWQLVRTFTAGSDTRFTFTGLDDGNYKLVESTVPEGYNKFEDVEFSITATHDANAANPTLTSLNGATADAQVIMLCGTQEASVSLSSGAVASVITNRAGSILPSTGGVGTKLFYAGGSILALGAGVLLIAKRRAKAEE